MAATLYNVWRSELIDAVIVDRLDGLGLEPIRGRKSFRLLPLLLAEEPFSGEGASGLDFFPQPAELDAADRRDVALLSALRSTLDVLASDRFAAAFDESTSQDDYRWGRLHRISIPHALGGARSIPPAGGFEDLAPGLPGISRDGGYHTLNRGARGRMHLDGRIAARSSSFEFNDSSSEQRRVMAPGHALAPGEGVHAFSSHPGGPSGDAESPFYASRLGRWLTVDYDPVRVDRSDVRLSTQTRQLFRPAP